MTSSDFTSSDIESYWSKVLILGPDDCWLWQAGRTWHGYGNFQIWNPITKSCRQYRSNRVAVCLSVGCIRKDLKACHSCDVNYPTNDFTYRLCCNPRHLWVGTQSENIADCISKGRLPRGEIRSQSKLTDEQVQSIRLRYANGGITQKMLADEFCIARPLVSMILSRKKWKHLT